MRSTQTCPKCAGKKFAVNSEFRFPDHQSSNGTDALPAITLANGSTRRTLGRFETWICVGCGYTEFYAYGAEDLEALARVHPEHLRIVDAEPRGQGPYR
jgi:predicted nucleic-acid-binding Zn-ribbon protein